MKSTTFRIFDCQVQKYISPADKSGFSLSITGEVIPPKKTPADSKYEVAYSLPMLDINGKQPFTDDSVIFLIGKGVHVGTLGYSDHVKSWICVAANNEAVVVDEFQILPNKEERAAGQTWEGILKVWDDKAAAIPEPISVDGPGSQTEAANDPLFYRVRKYEFAGANLTIKLSSEVDMPEEEWENNFKDALGGTDYFKQAHPRPAVTPEPGPAVVNEPAPVKYEPRIILDAKKLVDMPIAHAPTEWGSIRAVAQAYPNIPNCVKVLNRFGDTDLAQWYIGRHGNYNVASEVFLITKTPVEEDVQGTSISK